MSREQVGLLDSSSARLSEALLCDLLFELMRAEKHVNADDSLLVLSVFVPLLFERGVDTHHVDIYVEFVDVAELIDIRYSLAPSLSLTRAIEENLGHAARIETSINKPTYLTLVCLQCDQGTKSPLLEGRNRLKVVNAEDIRRRIEQIGIKVSDHWVERVEMLALTDALRLVSKQALQSGSKAASD